MNTWYDTGTEWVNLATGETYTPPAGDDAYVDTYVDTY